ncbi:homing endonuclease associated repeat-containing protein [Haloarcula nitratireducens]|uniref:Uncharacterized protein n=1 Tax=Haloarcula nitratireducens TaxID=2487749 RepID=A0AAW4PIL2_9EURY|nr:hypothetical protein [Halomicroarcula nitratireducens]MBX0297796.1 hypothetical protein [Halomicroarcula nitratireducens]
MTDDSKQTSGKISEADLLAEIQRLATEHGTKPTANLMDTEGKYASTTYFSRFGSWNTAIEEAGFEPTGPGPATIPTEELLAEVSRVASKVGRTPFAKDMAEHGAYNPETYKTRFGSWTAAIQEYQSGPTRD